MNGSANQRVVTGGEVRLPVFIRRNMERILEEWETFAHTITPAAYKMTGVALRNHAKEILEFIADDIQSPQTALERSMKSRGEVRQDNNSRLTAAQIHGRARVREGFDIVQMVSEYRALRASVIRLWTQGRSRIMNLDLADLAHFNAAIDQALAESVASFTEKLDHSRNLFLGILGHEIRSPLGAISMLADVIQRRPTPDAKLALFSSQISNSASRVIEILDTLIDLTRARLGTGIPVNQAPMDIGVLASHIVNEIRTRFPARQILLDVSGNLAGEWDAARLGQVFSNLLANAVQYSTAEHPVTMSVAERPGRIFIAVHNHGNPIAPAALHTIFDSLVRTEESIAADNPGSTNLGLGLYITKQIVNSHGGMITVTSSVDDGTTFSILIPRK